jgi:amidase
MRKKKVLTTKYVESLTASFEGKSILDAILRRKAIWIQFVELLWDLHCGIDVIYGDKWGWLLTDYSSSYGGYPHHNSSGQKNMIYL